MRLFTANVSFLKRLPQWMFICAVLLIIRRTVDQSAASGEYPTYKPPCYNRAAANNRTEMRPSQIYISWSFTFGIPPEGLDNIRTLALMLPAAQFTVFCGSARCMREINDIGNPSFRAVRLQVLALARDTPLKDWMKRHAIHKVISGPHFERHLQDAVKLCLLWLYGSLHIEPYLNIKAPVSKMMNISLADDTCVIMATPFPMHICRTEPKSLFISRAIKNFISTFDRILKSNRRITFNPFMEDKDSHIENPSCKANLSPFLPPNLTFVTKRPTRKFGLLSYDYNVVRVSMGNIGDEVQSLAAAHFVPQVNDFVDRDDVGAIKRCNCTVLGNAFWRHTSIFPVIGRSASGVELLPISVHLNQMDEDQWDKKLTDGTAKYLQSRGLVGTRDSWTFNILQKHNVSVIFTGCLTLFLQHPDSDRERSGHIYFVDYSRLVALKLFPISIISRAMSITHGGTSDPSNLNRFHTAYKLLDIYARAKLVITSRIHVALPCVAFGTPVIFINSAHLYGAGRTAPSSRVTGLLPLFHTIDLYKMSIFQARRKLVKFNYDSPPPNPNRGYRERLKQRAWSLLQNDPDIRESAITFGLAP